MTVELPDDLVRQIQADASRTARSFDEALADRVRRAHRRSIPWAMTKGLATRHAGSPIRMGIYGEQFRADEIIALLPPTSAEG